MSNEFYNKGVVLRIKLGSWSGKKKDKLSQFGVGSNIAINELVEDPSVKLIDSKWRNKIASAQLGFRNIPLKHGYRMKSKATYYITNEKLSAFVEDWNAKLATYQADVIEPLKAEFAQLSETRLNELRKQSQTIWDENRKKFETGVIIDTELLPEDFVDRRVKRMREVLDKVGSNIDDIYAVSWTSDESMSMVCLTDEAKELLTTLDAADAELREAIIAMSKQNVASVVKGIRFIWQDDIITRLQDFRKQVEPNQDEPVKINGKTIGAIKKFIALHITKKPDLDLQPVADRLLELNAILPDGKKVPYKKIDELRSVVYAKIGEVFKLVTTSAEYIEEKEEQTADKKRNLEIEF